MSIKTKLTRNATHGAHVHRYSFDYAYARLQRQTHSAIVWVRRVQAITAQPKSKVQVVESEVKESVFFCH